MLSTIKTKNKKPSILTVLRNMKTVMTLSERLKLAGIKECKPQPGIKPITNFKKNSKKRKNDSNTTTPKRLRNLPKKFFLKRSKTNQFFEGEIIPKNSSDCSLKNFKKNIKKSTEETLCASLDFIRDCQKYKNKIRNPKNWQLRNHPKRTIDSSIDPKYCFHKKEVSKNLQNENSDLEVAKEKAMENSDVNEDFSFLGNKSEKISAKETTDYESKSFIKDTVKTFQSVKALSDKMSSENIAKIDKKYLESLLSLATNTEEESKIGKEEAKKSNGKAFCTGKTINKELKVSYFKSGNKTDSNKEMQNTLEINRKHPQKYQTPASNVREFTKSEVQIQLRDKKYTCSQRNSDIKIDKDVVHCKPELSDERKKRKFRNKIFKQKNKEVTEKPFSSEVSEGKDVTELWRRETQQKYENSLSSHSSCTIPESDEIPKWKNLGLESYRILQKLVEEEVNKISKKSESKNNIGVKNKETHKQKVHERKAGSVKETSNFNKLKLRSQNNSTEVPNKRDKERLLVKNEFMMIQNLQNNSIYEGEKKKSELLSVLAQNKVKTPDLNYSDEKEKKFNNIPFQAIKNWCILNRLEQAFLALGSPNFQNETTTNIKHSFKNNSQKSGEFFEKPSEENEKQRNIKLQNRITRGTLSTKKTLGPLAKTPICDTQSISSKRKSQDVKFPSAAGNKQNKSCKRKSSNFLMHSKNAEETLERKGTLDVIQLKNPSMVQTQKSKSCNKIDNGLKLDKVKKRFLQTKNHQKKLVKNNLNQKSQSQSTEKKEEESKSNALKNIVKHAAPKENVVQAHENSKSGIPKLKTIQKKKCEKVISIEELSKQQVLEKKELNQSNSNERPVKGRSILSMRGNQHGIQAPKVKLQQIQEENMSDFEPALKSSTRDLIMKISQKNTEEIVQKSTLVAQDNNPNFPFMRTGTYEGIDSNLENSNIIENSQTGLRSDYSKKNFLESTDKLTSESNLSQDTLCQQNAAEEKNQAELASTKNLSLWERDIYHYREIVEDIMNQYKRIGGFLKQSEPLRSSSNKFVRSASSKKHYNNNELTQYFDDSQSISLQEYRKKIITEYHALPFFEYKQQKKIENFKLNEAKKRNLSVVTDIKEETDFDVKDYHPNVKKVLDSQLYVDTESLIRRNDSERKLKDKKSSLQEMVLGQNNGVYENHCLRSISMPKTFLLPNSEINFIQSTNRRQDF